MASAVRPRNKKAYDSVELKPLATATDDNDDTDDYQKNSKVDKWLNYALHKLHALLWVVLGTALALWTQLFEVVINGHPPDRPNAQINRCASCVLAHAPHLPRPSSRRRHEALLTVVCVCVRARGAASGSAWA